MLVNEIYPLHDLWKRPVHTASWCEKKKTFESEPLEQLKKKKKADIKMKKPEKPKNDPTERLE